MLKKNKLPSIVEFIFQCHSGIVCSFTGKQVGETILYFGCRHEAEDYIYRDELEKYKEDGTLSNIYTAFSRDGPKKVYVQHLLRQHGEEAWRIMEAGGHIYVCGWVSQQNQGIKAMLMKMV